MVDLPIGMIVVWPSAAAIPTGWHLCDGTGGTPDLRNRFVVGAGATYAVGDVGGAALYGTGSHSHDASVLETHMGATVTGFHEHAGTINSGETTPAAGGAFSAGGTVGVGAVVRHLHALIVRFTDMAAGLISGASNHDHTITGAAGAVDDGASTRLPPFVALYYIQRLS